MRFVLSAQLQSIVNASIEQFMLLLCGKCGHRSVADMVAEVFSAAATEGSSSLWSRGFDKLLAWSARIRETGSLAFTATDADTPDPTDTKAMFKLIIVPSPLKLTFCPSATDVEATLQQLLDAIVDASRGFLCPEASMLSVLQLQHRALLPTNLPKPEAVRNCEDVAARSDDAHCIATNARWAVAR